jgi:hypothetical protein
MTRSKGQLTDLQKIKVRSMRARGGSYDRIARRLGVSYQAVRSLFDPEFQDRVKARARAYAKENYHNQGQVLHPSDPAGRTRVSIAALQERDVRSAAADRRQLTGVICGDPPPGFSALDMKRRGLLL